MTPPIQSSKGLSSSDTDSDLSVDISDNQIFSDSPLRVRIEIGDFPIKIDLKKIDL